MAVHQSRDMNFIMCCGMLTFDLFLTFGLSLMVGSVVTRAEVRQRFSITKEGGCGSCLRAVCCLSCSTCQIYREMSMRGEWPGGICTSTPFVHPAFIPPPTVPNMNPSSSSRPPYPPTAAATVAVVGVSAATNNTMPYIGYGYPLQQPGYTGYPIVEQREAPQAVVPPPGATSQPYKSAKPPSIATTVVLENSSPRSDMKMAL
eukprot:CAMPEP_0176427604 /NCGR_PEP_ID=MMETSP0127-20121128/12664_1 /TAXON_ID=938130 /ORGANISM="Platyophrya macrostoma, Strain WH" /LENGTH=202 /DNA_ID=CAMNT_0017809149 /DNA_START=216 /DNA_END=824 /DNA_ORIENTATION=+